MQLIEKPVEQPEIHVAARARHASFHAARAELAAHRAEARELDLIHERHVGQACIHRRVERQIALVGIAEEDRFVP